MLVSLVAVLLAAGSPAPAAPSSPEASLDVRGDLAHPRAFTLAELQAMHIVETTWAVHGKEHKVRGVALDEVLSAAGFTPGAMGKDASGKETPKREKRSGWKKILIATAGDGFQAVFSAAELFPEAGATRALVIWEIDGAPLSAAQGPLRLSVLTDHEPSRSIYGVQVLEVIDARDLHAVHPGTP